MLNAIRNPTRLSFRFAIPLIVAAGTGCSGDSPDAPPDHIQPTVAITEPAAGVVSGVVSLKVSAVDNKRVAYVRWRVNSGLISYIDSTPPYQYDWDTATFAAGFYDWEAVATDRSGNIGVSAPVEYTINP